MGHLVVILAFPGAQLLDVTGPAEVFAAAAEAGAPYRVAIASADGEDVRTSGGVRLGVETVYADIAEDAGTLVVPGAPDWATALADPSLARLVAAAAARSGRVAAVCTGSFLVAATGRLDGGRAATHWRFAAELAARFPAVAVDPDAIFVRHGDVYTSAGVTAGIDLCLALVEADHGPEVARRVARQLVVFMQRPGGQAQFSHRLRTEPTVGDPLRGVLDHIAANPAADLRLDALAERAGFSGRHLARVFVRELGVSPARYVQAARIEAARQLLETGSTPLDGVAALSGFGSDETLRRVFQRELGVTPGAYRRRFRTTDGVAAGA